MKNIKLYVNNTFWSELSLYGDNPDGVIIWIGNKELTFNLKKENIALFPFSDVWRGYLYDKNIFIEEDGSLYIGEEGINTKNKKTFWENIEI